MPTAREHENLIPDTRDLLQRAGVPWCIENVEGAPLVHPIRLCGTMFGLGYGEAELRRHRLFEASSLVMAPPCRHRSRSVLGVYGGHVRDRRRPGGQDRGRPDFGSEAGRRAMGIDWMTLAELSQAIPPAYSRFLVGQICQLKKSCANP